MEDPRYIEKQGNQYERLRYLFSSGKTASLTLLLFNPVPRPISAGRDLTSSLSSLPTAISFYYQEVQTFNHSKMIFQ